MPRATKRFAVSMLRFRCHWLMGFFYGFLVIPRFMHHFLWDLCFLSYHGIRHHQTTILDMFYFFQASNMQIQEKGVCLNMAKKHPED